MSDRVEALIERAERSGAGRSVITAFVLVTLVCIGLVNLPDSEIKRRTFADANQYVRLTGADQGWGVFAPDARKQVFDMYALITYADGTTSTWRTPETGHFVGNYRLTRWRKWREVVVINDYVPFVAPDAARWLGRKNRRPGKQPVSVTFVRRIRDLYPPGTHPSESPWHVQTYYVVDLRGNAKASS